MKPVRWALLGIVVCLQAAHATDSMQVAANVYPSCQVCRMDQDMSILTTVENVGGEPVVVFGYLDWGYMAGLVVHLEDEAGEPVASTGYDDGQIVPSMIDDATRYITLEGSHSLGVRKSFRAADYFPGPGIYKLWVTYQSPVPSQLSLIKNHFLSRELGAVASPKVTITVQ